MGIESRAGIREGAIFLSTVKNAVAGTKSQPIADLVRQADARRKII